VTTATRPTPAARRASTGPSLRPASLAWRVVLLNSLVVLVATLALALGPATVSTPLHTREAVTLLVGVCVTLGANLVLVRRAFAPLVRLTRLMHKVDPLVPGRRLHVDAAPRELQELADAFNAMLERLEDERRESARRALRAQEAERRRVARELHDELGQTMTGVLLRIDEAIRTPESADLEEAREDARRSLDDVRRIARDLRPDTLAELGLASALSALATRFTRQTRVPVDLRLDDLPPLGEDAEIVIYRVAQEALTNVARHAGAGTVAMTLAEVDGAATLKIDDDGCGVPAHVGHEARGITGMRERALLVRGRLTVSRRPTAGTRVTLRVPVR
jgi:two-component system sensor histidine kinase UhpB